MKLYDNTIAPNPRRVRIFLSEKGIEVPLAPVDIMTRENRNPEFIAKNPVGGLPILELENGTCISESIAICRYFEELHPEPPLFGRSPLEKATIEMWLRRVELNVMTPVGMVWLHGSPYTTKVVTQIPEVAEQYKDRVQIGFKLLDDQLANNPFIAGNEYSIADSVALATIDFATGLVALPLDEKFLHLKRWHDLVSARPSARA